MGSRLLVEVADFVDAALTMNDRVAEPARVAFCSLGGRLDDLSAMAGSDPGGRDWAHSYDHAARSVLRATGSAVNGSYRLASMFGRSGLNYAEADAESTSSVQRSVTIQIQRLPGETYVGPAPDLPSSAGGNADQPDGWSLIEGVVDRVWPDGHQDRLHRAASAWTAAASVLDDAASSAKLSTITFARDDLPEADDMITVCGGLGRHLDDLAGAHRALAQACTDLAGHIDICHAAVRDELTDLLAWSAGIQAGGALLSLVSFGTAEVPTQGVQLAKITAAAVRIGVLIDKFIAAARVAFIGLPAVKLAADSIAVTMERLQATRLLAAGMEGVPLVRAAAGSGRVAALGNEAKAEITATGRLADTQVTVAKVPAKLRGRTIGDDGHWYRPRTLQRHFRDHGRQVGAKSADDYSRKATDFLQRAFEAGLPRLVAKDGTIRVFDSATTEFGSYRPDGSCITYFNAATRRYFSNQPGVLQ